MRHLPSPTCKPGVQGAGESDIGVTEGMLFRSGSTELGRKTYFQTIDLVTIDALASVRHRNPGIPQRGFNTNVGPQEWLLVRRVGNGSPISLVCVCVLFNYPPGN